MKEVLRVMAAGIAIGIMAGCSGHLAEHPVQSSQLPAEMQSGLQPPDLEVQGRVQIPCLNEYCNRDTYDLAWEHYYDYPVSHRTRQLQYDRNQLEYGYLRRNVDLWEPLAVAHPLSGIQFSPVSRSRALPNP